MSRHRLDGPAVALIVAFVASLSLRHMDLWWVNPDTVHVLAMVADFDFYSYFTEPHIYRLLTGANLTPWVLLSFDIDLALWGANPVAFRLHQLASGIALCISTYVLLRLWSEWWIALLATLSFTVMSTTVDAFFTLPLRHYTEGFVFTILSAYCFFRAQGGSARYRGLKLAISTLFYALAVTAKEVFVPLVVFLFLIDFRPVTRRLADLSGHLSVALGYSLWRLYMLGTLVGGYASTNHSSFDPVDSVFALITALPRALYFSVPTASAFLSAIGLLTAYLVTTKGLNWRYPAAFLLCSLGPILPVAFLLPVFGVEALTRYFFVMGWLLAVFAGITISRVTRGGIKWAAAISLTLTVFLGYVDGSTNIDTKVAMFNEAKARCGRFVWEGIGPSAILHLRTGSGIFAVVYYTYLAKFKGLMLKESSPLIFQDAAFVESEFKEFSFWVYDENAEGCFAIDSKFRQKVEREHKRTTIDTSWKPELVWLEDGFDWEIRRPRGSKLFALIGGEGRGARMRLKGSQGAVLRLREKLFSKGIVAPAFLRFKAVGRDGKVVLSQELPIPERFWSFMATSSSQVRALPH